MPLRRLHQGWVEKDLGYQTTASFLTKGTAEQPEKKAGAGDPDLDRWQDASHVTIFGKEDESGVHLLTRTSSD